jgi:6-phosphogluconolactonase
MTGDRDRIVRVADLEALAREAAADFTRRANEAVGARGRFAVALSGGRTPQRLYALLADEREPFRAQIPWNEVHLFWGDERHVPPDDPESNYRMVREVLLSRLSIPDSNVHRIEGEREDAAQAAALYESELRSFFDLGPGEFPRFDLILLGIGADGHTASLFPKTAALGVRDRAVVSNWVPKLDAFRITMTLPVFWNAAAVVFLVSGADKAAVLAAVFGPSRLSDPLPCELVRPQTGELVWLVDRAAAASVPP